MKKSSEHLLTGFQMEYQFIEQNTHEFPLLVMCNVLGVAESGFSTWRKRPACRRKREDAQLTQEIEQVYTPIKGDMAVRAFIVNCKSRGEVLLANAWPD